MSSNKSFHFDMNLRKAVILFSFGLGFFLLQKYTFHSKFQIKLSKTHKSFVIDNAKAQFLKDGKPFRFISGSFHYFRALPETWQRKLRTMRAAGLNAVSTSVEWSLHNPKDNEYDFNGIANLTKFIELAAKEDLLVILRPGPHTCADRYLGGFPYWLFQKYLKIKPRTFDEVYLLEVRKWLAALMSKMKPLLYGNGGPIIMVQIENKYGLFPHSDEDYINWMRSEIYSHIKENAVLFTADPPNAVEKGKVEGALATLNFGVESFTTIDSYWTTLKNLQPNGTLVNSEFYTGWLTRWQVEKQRIETGKFADTLDYLLQNNASVNLYMFYGGTNFGFTAGSNNWSTQGHLNADTTSYDYDAPMDESGDITEKYLMIRNVIRKYLQLPSIPLPDKSKKTKFKDIKMESICSIVHREALPRLSTFQFQSELPKTFEELKQNFGFVLYETSLPSFNQDPTPLTIERVRDRGYVLINEKFVGILSGGNAIQSIPIRLGLGDKLQILIENEGRRSKFEFDDYKGFLGQVKFGPNVLRNWTMTALPFNNYTIIDSFLRKRTKKMCLHQSKLRATVLLHAKFTIIRTDIYDTYLDPTGWGKGFVFINGFNIGRYWPTVGPQITLYIPKELLKIGSNDITIVELELIPKDKIIRFSEAAILDGFKNK